MRTDIYKAAVIICGIMFLLPASCDAGTGTQVSVHGQTDSLREAIRNEVSSYALDLPGWEIQNLMTPVRDSSTPCLAGIAERVSTVLKEEKMPVFPAVHVRIARAPLLLVVSPRDKIQYLDRVMLSPCLSDEQIETVEKKVEKLNLSALVIRLGGFGAAYPAIVSPDMDMKHQVSAVVEEWAHQYLAFRPLGFLYLLDCLGLSQAAETITMNETLAGMIADEIGDKVYERYCRSGYDQPPASEPITEFDYNAVMRETRKTVDAMLNNSNIEQAEQYMENRRQLFIKYGYRVRKLNQAYFAFHGIYGQDPCSVSPVYDAMTKLRGSYADLAGFVEDISNMKGYDELQRAINELPVTK